MSLLNVSLNNDRVLIGVDTEAQWPDGRRAACSKMVPIVAANAVMAHRGNVGFLSIVSSSAEVSMNDFDAAVEAMPAMLRRCFDAVLEMAQQNRMGHLVTEQLVVIGGWSESAQRMAVFEWTVSKDAVSPAALYEDQDTMTAPPCGTDYTPHSIDNMKVIAAAQAASWRETSPELPIGGRLIVAEITRGRTVISDQGAIG